MLRKIPKKVSISPRIQKDCDEKSGITYNIPFLFHHMLYIVGTPIGNLGDITMRAVEILRSAEIIIAESPADSRRLLSAFDIHPNQLIKYNEKNAKAVIGKILDLCKDNAVAFITSAGMPSISDPGSELVKVCISEGVLVVPIPGVSALTTAVSMSGFLGKRLVFVGFLPRRASRINELLARYIEEDTLFVFFESPYRIIKSIEFLSRFNPMINVCVCRELTKKFETYTRGNVAEVLSVLQKNPVNQKGEFTVVVSLV